VRWVQLDAMLRQLRLKSLPRAAELRIHRCFDNNASRVLVRRLRDFDMNIAIFTVDADFLYKGDRNVKNLKLYSGSRRIERAGFVLRPAINRIYRSLFRSHVGNGDVFLVVAVFDALIERIALAEVCRFDLAEIHAGAGKR